jgi:hypothetical protein
MEKAACRNPYLLLMLLNPPVPVCLAPINHADNVAESAHKPTQANGLVKKGSALRFLLSNLREA